MAGRHPHLERPAAPLRRIHRLDHDDLGRPARPAHLDVHRLSAGQADVDRQIGLAVVARAGVDEPEVHFNIGLTLYSEQDYRSALGEFYWIVQKAPDSSVVNDALYYSGMAFAKVGDCQKAIAYFGALTREESTAPDRYKKQATKQVKVLEADKGKICNDVSSKDDAASKADQTS